jgi:hypothetical protein
VIRVCVAGVTGWVGGPVADAVKAAGDLELVARVARSDATSFSSVAEALDAVSADVLVDYTSAMAVRENVLAAIERGVGVVVGSSGRRPRITQKSTRKRASDRSVSSPPCGVRLFGSRGLGTRRQSRLGSLSLYMGARRVGRPRPVDSEELRSLVLVALLPGVALPAATRTAPSALGGVQGTGDRRASA